MKPTFEMDGKTVHVSVDVLTADIVQQRCDIDILSITDNEPDVLILLEQPRVACSVVHLCSDASQDEDGMKWFAKHWKGDTIIDGVKALWGALLLFFPSHLRGLIQEAMEQSLVMSKQVAKMTQDNLANGRLTEAALKRVKAMSDQMLERSVAELSGTSVGNAPESQG